MDPKEQLKEFTEKFGAELANKYFTEGLDVEAATSKFCGVLQERLGIAEKLSAEKDGKIAELETKLGEAQSKIEVFEKQYGGLPYDKLGAQTGETTGNVSNPENEYAAELGKANVEPGNE